MKAILAILTLLAAFPIVSAQDTNARLLAQCGASNGDGYVNPTCGLGLGSSVDVRGRAVIDGDIFYLFARKRPGGGHAIHANIVGRIAFRSDYFLGPAFAFNQQTATHFTKSAFYVGGEGGKRFDSAIVSGRFLQDVTSVNKIRAYEFRVEHYGGQRRVGLYLAGTGGFRDFRCLQGNFGLTDHCVSGHVTGTLGVFIR